PRDDTQFSRRIAKRRKRVRIPLGSPTTPTTYVGNVDRHEESMKKPCFPAPGKGPRKRTRQTAPIRTFKAGSVHVKVYTGTLKGRPSFTVYWRVGERPFRKLFADSKRAEEFAKAQAEQLAAGQVNVPAISTVEVQTFREAQRRLGPVDVPLHVAASEYADVIRHLGDNGTLRQALE